MSLVHLISQLKTIQQLKNYSQQVQETFEYTHQTVKKVKTNYTQKIKITKLLKYMQSVFDVS